MHRPCEEARPRICRRLQFDDEDDSVPNENDRENAMNEINDLINRDLDAATQKYNFDFRSETPLEGPFKWERVAEDRPVEEGRVKVENLEVPPQEVQDLQEAIPADVPSEQHDREDPSQEDPAQS